MKHKLILALMIACVVVSGGIVIGTVAAAPKPDMVELNRIKLNAERAAVDFSDISFDSGYDFTVVGLDGAVRYSTIAAGDMPLDERTEQAVAAYDALLDYEKDGKIQGKIIVYTGKALTDGRALRIAAVAVPFAVLCVLLALYYFYTRVWLYKPFKRLKVFAADVAAGNLDLPLPADKDNLFGELTESFDLMREELKAARQRALDEERSKKELTATLAHDIKTPISIVRVASQLLESGETDGERLKNIRAIKTKTAEIDALINDLFSSALDELSELKLDVRETESVLIEEFIKNADHAGKVRLLNRVPECLITADPLRLNQVIGNIISNAYKYAGTDIAVTAVIDGKVLLIAFKDFGTSLQREELFLIKNKFYRGANANGKDGAGLGLYICQKLLEKMGGGLDFLLENDGFTVTVRVALC